MIHIYILLPSQLFAIWGHQLLKWKLLSPRNSFRKCINNIEILFFISVFEMAVKKFGKIVEESQEGPIESPTDMMIAVNDYVALFLEVLNAIITNSLKDNSNLTYILLQRKDLVEFFADYVRFKPFVQNILIVCI